MGEYRNEHLAETGFFEPVHRTVLVSVRHDEPEGGVDVGADLVSPALDEAGDDVPARIVCRNARAVAGLWPALEVDHGLEERADKVAEEQRGRSVVRAAGVLGIEQICARQQRSVDVAAAMALRALVVVRQVLHVRHCPAVRWGGGAVVRHLQQLAVRASLL